MIYFTSDLHLGHKNVISMCSRPFETVEEMDAAIINNWNSIIKDEDEVYILGDITLGGSWKIAINRIRELNGRKYLIKGNHDKYIVSEKFDRRCFEFIFPYHEMDYEGKKFVLCHYPMADWNGKFHGSIHLHGHIHSPHWSNLQEMMGRIYDVGVDANNYTPVSADEIIQRCNNIDYPGFITEYTTRRMMESDDE